MRRKVTGGGLLEAYALFLALVLGAGALFVGGARATTWAILSFSMAAALVVIWLQQRRRETGGGRQASDPRVLARRLLELLENSRPVPLVRQVRVDKVEVDDLVAAMREATANDLPKASSLQAVLSAAEAVEDAAYNAQPVPLTDHVRLPQERVDELVRSLRAAGA
jgi:hypothetical protein